MGILYGKDRFGNLFMPGRVLPDGERPLTKRTLGMTKKDGSKPAAKATDAAGNPAGDNVTGLGYNGEFRVGQITLGTGADGSLRLRHANDGSETEVAEILVEGVLEDAFFKRVIDEAGNDRKGTATKP